MLLLSFRPSHRLSRLAGAAIGLWFLVHGTAWAQNASPEQAPARDSLVSEVVELDGSSLRIVEASSLVSRFRIFATTAVRPRSLEGLREAWLLPIPVDEAATARSRLFQMLTLSDREEYSLLFESRDDGPLLVMLTFDLCGERLSYNECTDILLEGMTRLQERFAPAEHGIAGFLFDRREANLALDRILISDLAARLKPTPLPSDDGSAPEAETSLREDFADFFSSGRSFGGGSRSGRSGGSGSR